MTENVVDNALRLLRESSKSAYAIALGTGISKPTIGKYMKGETKPSAVFAEKLVNYFTCEHNGDNLRMLKDRVKQYCAYAGITISAFERRAGLSNGYFNQVKGEPGASKLSNIKNTFTDLNTEWLLTGQGPMLNTTPTLTTEETDPRSINPKKSPDMDIALALDFIGHLKEEVASLKEQLATKDAQIEQLIGKLPGGGF